MRRTNMYPQSNMATVSNLCFFINDDMVKLGIFSNGRIGEKNGVLDDGIGINRDSRK